MDETVAIAMTIGATRIRALAQKISPIISAETVQEPSVSESVISENEVEKPATTCFT